MGFVIEIATPYKTKFQKIIHKLFNCPTFWRLKTAFQCPICGKNYRCYWDGNDIEDIGTDICNQCAEALDNNRLAREHDRAASV